jgi:hypothetical protein
MGRFLIDYQWIALAMLFGSLFQSIGPVLFRNGGFHPKTTACFEAEQPVRLEESKRKFGWARTDLPPISFNSDRLLKIFKDTKYRKVLSVLSRAWLPG